MKASGRSTALLAIWTAAAGLATIAAAVPVRRSYNSKDFHALVEQIYRIPPELKAWRVEVAAPRAIFNGTVDFDRIDPQKRAQIPWPFSSMANGLLEFSAEGQLRGSAGKGYFDLEALRLGSVEIPAWLIRSLTPAEAIDQTAKDRLVLTFPLPDGVQGLELVDQNVILIHEQTPAAGHAASR
jgi:hypothetical protein